MSTYWDTFLLTHREMVSIGGLGSASMSPQRRRHPVLPIGMATTRRLNNPALLLLKDVLMQAEVYALPCERHAFHL